MKNHFLRKKSQVISIILLVMPSLSSAGESCNSILNLGLYNTSFSSSAADGQSMGLSTFCSADYSSSTTNTAQKAAIKGAFGLFSAGASGSVTDSEIIVKQSSLCTSGFVSSEYSNQASAYSRVVYQGTLDAWNKCQELSQNKLDFQILTSSTLQGLTVTITPAAGVTASFLGVYQDGEGSSICKRTLPASGGTTGKVVTIDETSSFKMTAAKKVTINCERIMQHDSLGNLSAEAQDIIFVTSVDSLRVPMAAIGSLARSSVDKIKAEIEDEVERKTQIYLTNTTNLLTTQITSYQSSISQLESKVENLKNSFASKIAVYKVSRQRCDAIIGKLNKITGNALGIEHIRYADTAQSSVIIAGDGSWILESYDGDCSSLSNEIDRANARVFLDQSGQAFKMFSLKPNL